MTYKGYEIKKMDDGSYSVFIDKMEDMADLPTEEAAKAFIDGKFTDKKDELSKYAPKVKHLTKNQVDKYVYYDPYDFIDTDNVYQLSYKTKGDRRTQAAQLRKLGYKIVDTTDADEGRYPYWLFVVPTNLDESKLVVAEAEESEDDASAVDNDDSEILDIMKEYEGIDTKKGLIDLIIDDVIPVDPSPEDDYFAIYAAARSDEISTQYSYNRVYQGIADILPDVFYPIIRDARDNEEDISDAINDNIQNNADVISEMSWINNQVSEYGDALADIWSQDASDLTNV